MLSLLARGADSLIFVFADSSLRKSEQSSAVPSFIRTWKGRTGAYPWELVFDRLYRTTLSWQ